MKFLILFGFILLVFKSIEIENIEGLNDKGLSKNSPIIEICVIVQEILPYVGFALIIIGLATMILL